MFLMLASASLSMSIASTRAGVNKGQGWVRYQHMGEMGVIKECLGAY